MELLEPQGRTSGDENGQQPAGVGMASVYKQNHRGTRWGEEKVKGKETGINEKISQWGRGLLPLKKP